MPTLATAVDGLKLPNPFVIASGPPGTNLNVISRAFREGWGAVIAKLLFSIRVWSRVARKKAPKSSATAATHRSPTRLTDSSSERRLLTRCRTKWPSPERKFSARS
jgi:hypothetical protein